MTCHIRLATEQDAQQIQAIYEPIVSQSFASFEAEAPDVDEMARRIADGLRKRPWLVCERDGEILGYAYAAKHRSRLAYQWSVESSLYVREGCRRQGVGRALYASLFEILRLQRYYNVYAGVTMPNDASIRLHEACGFQLVGVYREIGFKLGAWHDVAWYELRLADKPGAPEAPLDLPEVRTHPGFDRAVATGEALLRT